jgi:hypothetical protein
MDRISPDEREARIHAYLTGAMSPQEREAFERAWFDDDELAEEIERAVEVRAALSAPRHTSSAVVRRSRAIPVGGRWLALAAALGMVAFGSVLWLQRDPGAPVMRAGEERLKVEVAPAPGGIHLVWPQVEGAESYRIDIFTASGERLTGAELRRSPYLLADSVTPTTPGPLYARIVALDHVRRVLADSRLIEARPSAQPPADAR